MTPAPSSLTLTSGFASCRGNKRRPGRERARARNTRGRDRQRRAQGSLSADIAAGNRGAAKLGVKGGARTARLSRAVGAAGRKKRAKAGALTPHLVTAAQGASQQTHIQDADGSVTGCRGRLHRMHQPARARTTTSPMGGGTERRRRLRQREGAASAPANAGASSQRHPAAG